jgi:4-hydroxy-tetrahydrodipicolinate synthase
MLAGVFPIVVTPFHDDGSIDYPSLDNLVDHLLEQGAHGLGLFGNASEGYTLKASERAEMLKRIVKRVDGRVPLVVSTGSTGTDTAVEQSVHARELGASALMVLPPYFLKPDGDGLMFYFDAVAKAARIPVMVQDAPLMTQVAMPVPLLARMAREIEHVQSVKVEAPPTAPKIGALAAAAGAKLALFGGLNGQFLIEEIGRGAVGTMPSSDMTWVYVTVMRLVSEGRSEQAWRLFSTALPLIRYELQPGLGVSAAKHNLVMEGVIASARVRHPTSSIDAAAVEELRVLRELVEQARQPA